MSERSEWLDTNRRSWDERVPIHAASQFYDLPSFERGRCSLRPLEVAEVGDVRGRSLLHLQCHFGQDTLSWARRGARVTGVDFSASAIGLARELNDRLGLDARFICSDLYELPRHLDQTFDVVFTSYGVLCWLPDLTRWAEIIAGALRPGGVFYLAETHPLAYVFDDDAEPRTMHPRFDYTTRAPLRWSEESTYADRSVRLQHTTTWLWNHGLGEIVGALLAAGLRLEFLHEWPFCVYPMFAGMVQGDDGWWRLPEGCPELPLTVSLRAARD